MARIITRILKWLVRPWVYYCKDPSSVSYRPDVYTQEIYKEIADDEHPFTDTLEEWRKYAERQKEDEMRAAADRRWRLPEKPSLCFKIDEKEPSTAEEIIEGEVPIPPVPKEIIEAIKGYERSAKSLRETAEKLKAIPELKEDFLKRADELEGKAKELRKKYGLEGKDLE